MKITIKDLSVDEVNLILNAIQELPAKIANPMTEKIRNQALQQVAEYERQQKAAQETVKETVKETTQAE